MYTDMLISMPNFVNKTLNKLNYICKTKHQLALHKWTIPIYGKNKQFPQPIDISALLDKEGIKYVQRTVGSFLYYTIAIDNTILPALNETALSQAKPTQNTLGKMQMLLDYLNTYLDAKIRFLASDMNLHVDSDAVYLVAPNAKSRISGFYYMSDIPKPKLNGPVLDECKLLKHIVTSTAEADTAGLFYNTQADVDFKIF